MLGLPGICRDLSSVEPQSRADVGLAGVITYSRVSVDNQQPFRCRIHGVPSWNMTVRNVLPPISEFVATGRRVVTVFESERAGGKGDVIGTQLRRRVQKLQKNSCLTLSDALAKGLQLVSTSAFR